MTVPPESTLTARPEVVTEEFPRSRPAWIGLATSGDHKAVGTLYIATAFAFLVLALVELVLMRVQLIVPDSTLIEPEIFYRLLSAYGATSIVLFALPLVLGLACYVMPLQIGSRRTALPHLGMLSFWLYAAGGITLYASFLYRPSEAGINPLPPLSDEVFMPTAGVDAWIAGVGLAVLGFVLMAVNLLATVHSLRAPGMAWRRLPLFSWASTVSAYVVVVVGAAMLAALTMLLFDRHFEGVFFASGEGGAPYLWQHLSWLFFTGAYLVVVLGAFGAISEILPVLSGKPAFGHRAIAGSFVAIGALGVLAWMQNMYSAPLPTGWSYMAMAAAVALVVPIGLVLFNWLATLWGGVLHIRAPLLFALGAISTMSFGLAGELANSIVPVGWLSGNTMIAWQDTHYALIGAAVFGGFAALYYWFPKITGRAMSEALARASFWALLVGVHVTMAPMFLAGLEGQPTDLYKYYEGTGLGAYNLISTVGSFILAAGIVLTLVNAARSVRSGIEVGHDPWGGETLEWFSLSPPPEHNFDVVPDVRSTEPLRDIREALRQRTGSEEQPRERAASLE